MMARRARNKRSGNKGHRLQKTRAPSRKIVDRMEQARKPQPVTIIKADGTTETVPASRFRKSP